MDFSTWAVFCAVSLVTAFTPGPGVLLAISNSVRCGARNALLSSSGNAVGVFIVSAAAMAGLGALLKTSATLFVALKFFGAAYLIYLGIRQWRSKENIFSKANDSDIAADAGGGKSGRSLFAHGVFVASTNPKSILFFTALFPQFMKPNVSGLEQFFVLTATFVACTLVSHVCYVLAAHSIKGWFSDGMRVKLFNRFAGSAFILLGIGISRLKNQAA
jgi:homoserine/homoserine lactone efflux protein